MGCCQSCNGGEACQSAYRFAVVQQAEEAEDMILWGPVSVESVSQDDKLIRMAAIEAALPYFWKRGALTMLHKDALIVGKVEELIPEADVNPDTVNEAAKPLVQSLLDEHGGLPTGILEVSEEMVAAFPHLDSVKGTRQFFAAARIYNDGDEASQAAMNDVRSGELDSFSLAGLPIEAQEVEHCEGDVCRKVIDVSKMTLSAITLGSRHGGQGPYSARTRNNGAAFIAVTQAKDGVGRVEVLENGAVMQNDAVLKAGRNHVPGSTMTKPPVTQEAEGEEAPAEEQDEPEGVDVEALASAFQDLARRVEALEQRLEDSPAEEEEDEDDEEEAPSEEADPKPDVAKAVTEAVQQATAPLLKRLKALEGHKVFEQADTPPPASAEDPKDEAAKALEQASVSGDPYTVKEALRKMRGTT